MTQEDGAPAIPDLGDSIDPATFEQILEMDDDEDEREFSRSIVDGFFEQAQNTFEELDRNLETKDLNKLSELGHYLKGSSATLGLNNMKASCEKIQHWGKSTDETGTRHEDDAVCLKNITQELGSLRKEYLHVEKGLKKFYKKSM